MGPTSIWQGPVLDPHEILTSGGVAHLSWQHLEASSSSALVGMEPGPWRGLRPCEYFVVGGFGVGLRL